MLVADALVHAGASHEITSRLFGLYGPSWKPDEYDRNELNITYLYT